MSAAKRAWAVALVASAVALESTPVHAHVPDVTTARVSLRDGHVEIGVDADVVALAARSLGGGRGNEDAALVATSDEAALVAALAEVRRQLAEGSHLHAGGVDVPLVVRWFPSPEEVRAAAAEASSARAAGAADAHPRARVVRIETTKAIGDARDLRVALPSIVGRTLYTFVQPDSRVASAGAQVEFVVLAAPGQAPPASITAPVEGPSRSMLATLAILAAIVAIAAQVRPWRFVRRVGERSQAVRDGGGDA